MVSQAGAMIQDAASVEAAIILFDMADHIVASLAILLVTSRGPMMCLASMNVIAQGAADGKKRSTTFEFSMIAMQEAVPAATLSAEFWPKLPASNQVSHMQGLAFDCGRNCLAGLVKWQVDGHTKPVAD